MTTTSLASDPLHTMHVLDTESLQVTTNILSMLRSGSSLCTPQDLMEVLFTEEGIREQTRNEAFQEMIARGENQLFEIGVLEQQLARLTIELERIDRDKVIEKKAELKENQKEYDLVIDIPSLRAVMGDGWAVEGGGGDCSNGSTESERGEGGKGMDCAVVAVVGLCNKGKTFLLNKFASNDLPNTPTKGLSFKAVQMDHGTNLTLVDTAGFYKPVKILDDRSILEQETMELFLLDVILDLSDYFICVVNDWTFIDQRYLDKIARYLSASTNRSFKEIIVVHNLRYLTDAESLKDTWNREVAQVVGKLQQTQVAAINPYTGKIEMRMVAWAQSSQCRHICIVNDNCALGHDFNPWTISLLKYWLKGIVVPVARNSTILAHTLTLMAQKLSIYYRQKVTLELKTTENDSLIISGTMGSSLIDTRKKEILLTASELKNMDPDGFSPSVDIIRKPDAYLVYLTIPGFSENDLSLARLNTTTIVTGRKACSTARGKWAKKERHMGDFTTAISVPREYNKRWTTAELKDGILCIKYDRDVGEIDRSLSASFCTDKLLTLNSRLPSISQPSKVLIALKDKQRIFKEMNESLCEERLKSLNESRYEWESMAKRTTALRKKKKKGMGRPTKSLLEMLYNEELYEEPEDQDVFWKEIGGDFGPGTRTNASLTTVRDMAVILHGGETHTTLADTWIFSLGSLLWSPVYFIPRVLEPRSGHCSLVINHQVIVVGGETSHHSLPRIRQLLPSILSLNMDESVSGELHTLNPYIGMRKFHCAVDSGRHIFIHGGYGEKNELLDDPAELNLAFLRWKSVRATGSGPGPRAYHAAVTVPWNGKNAANEGGIYVFGGLDDRHVARDTMHVLRFSTHGSTWSSPATTGEAPAARYQHTMTCFPDLSLLVVYGGRQDAHSSSGYRCFGELHILHLSRLKWTKAVFRGSPPENRCGHLATAVGSKLVIFGGIHNSHFCSGSIFLAEMDKESSVRLIADDERRKDLLNRVEQFKLRSRLQKGTVRGTRKHVYFSLNSSPLCSPIPDLLTMLYQKVHSTNGEENSRKGVLE